MDTANETVNAPTESNAWSLFEKYGSWPMCDRAAAHWRSYGLSAPVVATDEAKSALDRALVMKIIIFRGKFLRCESLKLV